MTTTTGTAPLLESTIAAVAPPDAAAVAAATQRQGRLTKPPGSMGALEDLGIRLSGMYGVCPPPLPAPVAVAVFAGDHGVHAQGVTPWPQEVTLQMVGNIAAGGAVVNALGRSVHAEVVVVDLGVKGKLPQLPGVLDRRIADGTDDFTQGPAMSLDAARAAIEVGISVAADLVDEGNRLLVTGDLGLANTTPSAALVAVFTGRDPVEVTGRGAGSDDAMLAHKVEVVRAGLALHGASADRPLEALAAVGGYEHAGLVGLCLGAAARHTPVLLDGVIACSAALVAQALCPGVTAYLVAGHRSQEPGATAALEHLGLDPLLDLGLRLGEGSGGVLAVPLVQAAARLLRDVATFDDAGVSEG